MLSARTRMNTNKVIVLQEVREARATREEDLTYQGRVLKMDKLELLEEMVRFQEERTAVGYLTLKMMVQGQILFKVLEEKAETLELRDLAGTYSKHLKLEMQEKLKSHAQ